MYYGTVTVLPAGMADRPSATRVPRRGLRRASQVRRTYREYNLKQSTLVTAAEHKGHEMIASCFETLIVDGVVNKYRRAMLLHAHPRRVLRNSLRA